MMRRRFLVAPILLTAALAVAGCAGGKTVTTAGGSPEPTASGSPVAAAWLAGGSLVGVVTWGSSTCVPAAGDVSADGQDVGVELTAPAAGKPCTMDYVPRVTLLPLPRGVDATHGVSMTVRGEAVGTVALPGLPGATPASGEGVADVPSAGWFSKTGAVLLTWGSSSCRPEVQNVTLTGPGTVTVTFATPDPAKPCTMDIAPRAQLIDLPEGLAAPATMTLTGDSLAATVPLLGAP